MVGLIYSVLTLFRDLCTSAPVLPRGQRSWASIPDVALGTGEGIELIGWRREHHLRYAPTGVCQWPVTLGFVSERRCDLIGLRQDGGGSEA